MRVVLPKQSLKKLLRWSQSGLFACGVAMLGYCAFVVVDTRVFQERESRTLERLLEDRRATGDDSPQAKLLRPPKFPSASAMSGLIGALKSHAWACRSWSLKEMMGRLSGGRQVMFPGRHCPGNSAT